MKVIIILFLCVGFTECLTSQPIENQLSLTINERMVKPKKYSYIIIDSNINILPIKRYDDYNTNVSNFEIICDTATSPIYLILKYKKYYIYISIYGITHNTIDLSIVTKHFIKTHKLNPPIGNNEAYKYYYDRHINPQVLQGDIVNKKKLKIYKNTWKSLRVM